MTRAVASELFKQRTTRSFWWLNIVLLGLVLVAAILFGLLGTENPLEGMLYFFGSFVQALALMFGALMVTTEFRHGTITPALLVIPNRLKLLAAKLVASLLTGAVLGLVSSGLIVLIVVVFASGDFDTSGDKLAWIAGATLTSALTAALGVGVGALVYLFGVELIISLIIELIDNGNEFMERYSLGAVTNSLSGVNPNESNQLDQVAGGLLLALYVVIFLAAGMVMMRRRDVTA